MGTLVIKAPLAIFAGSGSPPALTCFRDLDGKELASRPSINGDEVWWTVPFTPVNADAFHRNYEPSGLYSCETVDLETPKPFSVSRKAAAKPATTTPPKTTAAKNGSTAK